MAVLNKYKHTIPKDAVYIGRGSMWGNPFIIGKDGDRDAVCDLHKHWLKGLIRDGKLSINDLAKLHGKDLVCFCAPARCHGDTLVKAAEWAVQELSNNN